MFLKLKVLHWTKGKNKNIPDQLSMTIHGKSLKLFKLYHQAPKECIFLEIIAKFASNIEWI